MTAESGADRRRSGAWGPKDLLRVRLASPGYLRDQLQRFDLQLRRRRGQHFLVDRNHLAGILNASDTSAGDTVFEVGAGLGTVTQALAASGARVLAVEIDAGLAAAARQLLDEGPEQAAARVRIVEGNALDVDVVSALKDLAGAGNGISGVVKVVANLPYQITGPITARLLRRLHPRIQFERLVLMVQRQVADRMQAAAGTPDYGAFSLLVQYFTRAEVVADVPRGAFFPPPKVASTVVRLTPREPPLPRRMQAVFFRLTRSGFNQRRKTLPNALAGAPQLQLDKAVVREAMNACGLDPRQRAETLDVEEFAALAQYLESELANGADNDNY